MADTEQVKKPEIIEIATIAKDIDLYAGWLNRLENPDPVLRTEAAGRGLRLYDEIDRDSHAGSVLQTRALAVVGKDWSIVPAKSAKKAGRPAATSQEKFVADFVTEVLEGCNFDQARAELLQAILYGYYAAEVLWAVRPDGRIGIKKILGKHPRRFVFTPEREPRLLTPQSMIDGEPVPARKFVVFTFGDSDNPYGKGVGRRLWWPVWFKKNGIKFWMIFLDKFGMPTTVGKYPPGTLKTEQDALLAAIDAIQTDTGIKIPDTMSIEFLEAARAGTVTHEALCEYMDRQISKAVLGQTASTEGTAGKLGNEEAQDEVRQDILEADADLLDTVLNETLIRWIVDYNFAGVTDYPKIVTHAAASPDLKERIEIDSSLASDVGLPMGKQYFYETYGIPEPAEGEELVKPSPKSPFGGMEGAMKKKQPPEFAEGQRFTPDQAALERFIAKMRGVPSEMETKIIASVESAQSYEEAMTALLDTYPDFDADELADLMERALFNAELFGRYAAGLQAKE